MNVDLNFLSLVFPVFFALVGFPALGAALINLGKVFGVVGDNNAPTFLTGLNLIGFVVVFYFVATNQVELLKALDLQLSIVAAFVVSFTTFAVEVGLTKVFHSALRGIPWIGFSYSAKKKK